MPVEQVQKAHWVEGGCLSDDRTGAVFHDLELEPGAPRQLHLREQPQKPVRLERLDSLEVHGVARQQLLRVPPTAPHAGPACHQVEEAPQAPQPVGVVPAGLTTDAADRPEGLRRTTGDACRTGVHQPRPEPHAAPSACRGS